MCYLQLKYSILLLIGIFKTYNFDFIVLKPLCKSWLVICL